MKHLARKLALVAAPFVLYIAFFFVFEPYDYFGLKGGAANEDSVITRVRAYLGGPQDAVILGDSRMAHFDMALVQEVSGRAWSNLAFGGASMNESIDLFYLAAETNPSLDTCFFEVSFYTLRAGDERNRTAAIRTVAQNPAAYFLNFDYNADMLNNVLPTVRHWLDPSYVVGATRDEGHWTQADYVDENGDPLPYRRNLMEYAQNTIAPICAGYAVNEENMAKLEELAAYCRENGIALTFVMPPVDGAIREYVLEDGGILPVLADVKARLAATGAAVRDFECDPETVYTQDQFYDGFHLDVVTGLPEYTRALFGA